jgi:hypothetical protein
MPATWLGWSSAQTPDDGVEVVGLVGEGVGVIGRFVGFAPTEEVEHDNVTALQMRDQPVVQVVVIGKAVEQHDGRSSSGLLAGMDPMRTSFDADGPGRRHGPHLRGDTSIKQVITSLRELVAVRIEAPRVGSARESSLRPVLSGRPRAGRGG